ncbi:MAG: ATP-binding cassette domain-containing protein [Synechococcaceae cyanobacterium SM2_3_1]|nr:ATP-binding cassette domain-containing protein [Synechococcaceae cyanobacterium SM2_3_1]
MSQILPILEVQHLGRKLDQHWLWQGISFSLPSGCSLALMGASGSGKTLLLRSLAGLDEVAAGSILLLGKAQQDWSMPEYRRQIMYLSQRPAIFAGTVEDNLKRVWQLQIHQSRLYDREKILAYLEQLHYPSHFLEQPGATLSGGERQLLNLLRSLQLDPHVLLLDEPTASLDAATALRVESLLQTWVQAAEQRVCIWTSHQSDQLHRVCNTSLLLHKSNHD